MKIVYFSLPAHGHINPTIVLMQELIRRGHEVIYYSSDEYREKVTVAGITFKQYHSKPKYGPGYGRHIGIFGWQIVELAKSELNHILPVLQKEKPDLVIHDSIAMWGKFAAHKLAVPAVSIFTTMMFPLKMTIRYPKA